MPTSNIKVSKNGVVRDGIKLLSLTAAEKTAKCIDYMWFSKYEGGTYGFDFDSGDLQSITGGEIDKIHFPDWTLETSSPGVAAVKTLKGDWELVSGSSGGKTKSGILTLTLKVNGTQYDKYQVPIIDMRGFTSVEHMGMLPWGIPSQQCSVIYRGNLFIGTCYVFCLGGFVVLLQDDLRFDALCTLSGAKNFIKRGNVIRIKDILTASNPYIVQMALVHHSDPELPDFKINR